jgi:DNA invertase Pin-like site-specific DNA recombinase
MKRVAIYCRKSSSEGLDSDFNSLDAQRLACEQFAASQAQEGWEVSAERYDDGGFSGGTTERPALARLLADVRAGTVQIIAVYKLDRLSRSLTDFVSLLQVLDEHDVAFVSVTQHFNTATPMGRLMLHILICFAQFERENAIERIRDKVAATKRQGRWCGGRPILGYDVAPGGRRLLVNPAEAEQVRTIFALYQERRSLSVVLNELHRRGWTNKAWTTQQGRASGGVAFAKSTLARLLANIVYTGRIRYKGEIIVGDHPPIIDTPTWEAVQRILAEQGRGGGHERRARHHPLLQGLLTCTHCDCGMTYTWTRSGGVVHAYYSCHRARELGAGTCPMPNLPAEAIEQMVVAEVAALSRHPAMVDLVVARSTAEHEAECSQAQAAVEAARAALAGFPAGNAASTRQANGRRLAEEALATARARLARLQDLPAGAAEHAQALGRFDDLWAELNHAERRQLVRCIVRGVHVDGARGTLRIDFVNAELAALAGGSGS